MTRFFASRGVSKQGLQVQRAAPTAARWRRPRSAWVLVATCLVAAPAAAIDFAFIYEDPEGAGFLDPVFGSERRQALTAAADIWGRLIMSSHAGETVTVKASFADYATGSNVLASASPHHYYSEFSTPAPRFEDTNYPKALANHLHGGNLVPARHDITVRVNRAANFYFGSDAAVPGSQFDFISVAAHEIGHGLGFTSSFREDGDYGIYGDGSFAPVMLPNMLPTPYDHFVSLGGGLQLLTMSSAAREANLTSGALFWSGVNAIQGNGGNPVGLFAPNPWQEGSSVSHVTDANSIIFPSFGAGQLRRTPSALERGMLRDMGWTISVFASELTWTGAGSPSFSQAASWDAGKTPLPGDSLVFGAAGAAGTDIAADLDLRMLGRIRYSAEAPGYTLHIAEGTDIAFTGEGLVNESAHRQSVRLASGAVMAFESAASAARAEFRLAGGETRLMQTQTSYYFDRTASGRLSFSERASATDSHFFVGGGAGNGGIKGQVLFRGNGSAAEGMFVNEGGRPGDGDLNPYTHRPTIQFGFGGETRFEDDANAGRARITNQAIAGYANQGTGGYTTFAGRSSAAGATIENLGGDGWTVGGVTEFIDHATAGDATFTNFAGRGQAAGRTAFFGHSSAGTADFINRSTFTLDSGSDPGLTVFRDFSTAASATIVNEYGGRTAFYGDSRGGNAIIRLTPFYASSGFTSTGNLSFHDRATAGDAVIVSIPATMATGYNKVVVEFRNESTAGSAGFISDAGAAPYELVFRQQSSAGSARFFGGHDGQNRVEFFDGANAGSANLSVVANGILGFYDNSNAAHSTLLVEGWLSASRYASLGSANITILGNDSLPGRVEALKVEQGATLGDATVELRGGTVPNARGAEMVLRNHWIPATERAGRATVIALGGQNGGQGGSLTMEVELRAPGLRLVAEDNGRIKLAPLFPTLAGTLQVGSIEGSGLFQIDGGSGVEFETGRLDTSTAVSGVISGSFRHLSKVGSGTLSLDGINTYRALTRVDEGALAVNGSILRDVVVNPGAALKGTGSIGGTVTVNPGGIFAPGLSPGSMQIGSLALLEGGILEMELGTTARDHVTVMGDASFAGTLNFLLLDGFLPATGEVINLFEIGGTQQGSFAQVLFPNLAAGFQYEFSFEGGHFALVALNDAVPVPEPGTVWLLVCGGLAVFGWIRRARRV